MKSVTASSVNGWAAEAWARRPVATQLIASKSGNGFQFLVISMMFPGNGYRPCGFIGRARVKRFYLLGAVWCLAVATWLLAVPESRQAPASGSQQGSLFCLIICDSSFFLWVRWEPEMSSHTGQKCCSQPQSSMGTVLAFVALHFTVSVTWVRRDGGVLKSCRSHHQRVQQSAHRLARSSAPVCPTLANAARPRRIEVSLESTGCHALCGGDVVRQVVDAIPADVDPQEAEPE